jgi:hypothetical protein
MSFIDSNNIAWQQYTQGLAPVVSLSGKSATSSVPAVLNGTAVRNAAIMVVQTSAGVSGGSVVFEGSLDNASWFAIGSAVTTSSASTVYTVVETGVYARYVRSRIATTVSGGTVTSTVALSG